MVKPSASRGAILDLHQKGVSPSDIIRRLKLPRRTVYDAIALGTLKDRPRTERKVTVTTNRLKKIVKKRIQRNPRRSIRGSAKDLKIPEIR
ncbi:unnamed protein product, partial [Mesorhabditis belari]|uniref:Resolvase HTH domain-containing protein n=1 Tax=Mesorhabditis belari TaxID=2138241 RepID=A0AAF3EF25_9BILA